MGMVEAGGLVEYVKRKLASCDMSFNLLRLAFLLKQGWSWFARPIQLGVRIILVQDGAVLLVRHSYMAGGTFLAAA